MGGVLDLVMELLRLIADIIKARGDAAKEEQAMMEAQELLKAELDRRKFPHG